MVEPEQFPRLTIEAIDRWIEVGGEVTTPKVLDLSSTDDPEGVKLRSLGVSTASIHTRIETMKCIQRPEGETSQIFKATRQVRVFKPKTRDHKGCKACLYNPFRDGWNASRGTTSCPIIENLPPAEE